jgi:hypothetical protein
MVNRTVQAISNSSGTHASAVAAGSIRHRRRTRSTLRNTSNIDLRGTSGLITNI